MAIAEVNDNTFQDEIANGTVLVDFWAPWCGPCKMIAPVLEEIDGEIGDMLKIRKLNVDHNPNVTQQYGVMSIPTLMLFRDGQVIETFVGYQPKANLLNLINQHI
ncbi:thioredoxin [Brevibacillus fluminis]|uniref:Thioredoxin n=1 Tax=Brevibacillus fluminis TaxID=511487 RepID=A0A3M8D9U9_9BACL|nr:thioredoxin [Brevibacillus fluminis]RNB84683.1 thioredoxin [Brevibacillus fluminis]